MQEKTRELTAGLPISARHEAALLGLRQLKPHVDGG